VCHASGDVDPEDTCRRCDPSVQTDDWSPNHDADARGLSCQLDRIAAAVPTLACPPRLVRVAEVRVERLRRLSIQLAGARPARARRVELRIARRAARLLVLLQNAHCVTAATANEVARLREQVLSLVAAR
jgi:hypothetical protein